MEEDKSMKRQKVYKVIMLVLLTSFITFLITSLSIYTYYSNNSVILEESSDASNITNNLERIRSIIDKYYLWSDDVDENSMLESTIAGYVAGLGDKYTEYIPKEEMEEFTEDITGKFVGIGIYMIADEEKGIIVYYPIPESPAEKAGIKAGDIIVSVDGVEYGYEDFDNISDYIKGEEGTKVKIVVQRDGKQKEFEITRATINTNPIVTELLENNIGYLVLPSFDEGTAENFKTKVEELIDKGATSLIIDLRNNGGGILEESTDIADYFLDKGLKIIETSDADNNREVTLSENDPIFDLPVVVLSNENTASASEVLIGALKDNNRATIIGEKTYGKGVIQTVIGLSDGSGLKLTTAEYHTPNGTAINNVGIEPNIKVELPETVKNIYSVSDEDDTQLKRAIEELKK